MEELIKKWQEFIVYATEHNQKQPGYPSYFENGIPLTLKAFIKWLSN